METSLPLISFQVLNESRKGDNIDDDPFDDDQPELTPYHEPDEGRLLRDHIRNIYFF